MRKRTKVSIVAAVLVAGSVGAGGAAIAGNGGDDEGHVTGQQAEQAKAAALKATGGGHANAVERDSENGATWEVEVKKPDGTQVDVRLDADYRVVVIEPDGEGG
ncbi:MAG: PepSY domain-containing protein [Nocardioidaceae bacterium]|nr:PepSY domain-containing protein [Nocardioidaceae bacterium]